jgi:hypothetical protein
MRQAPELKIAFLGAVVLALALAGSVASAASPVRKASGQFVSRHGPIVTLGAGQGGFPEAFCSPGEQAVGSGFTGNVGFDFLASLPLRADGTFAGEGDVAIGWHLTVINTSTEDKLIGAVVVCASGL